MLRCVRQDCSVARGCASRQRWTVVGINGAVALAVLGLLVAVVVQTRALGRPTVQAGAYIFVALAFGCTWSKRWDVARAAAR